MQSYDIKAKDIRRIKKYFWNLEYKNGIKRNDMKITQLREALYKYSNDNFYITYCWGPNSCFIFDVLTQQEVNLILPTGIDAEKICYSKIPDISELSQEMNIPRFFIKMVDPNASGGCITMSGGYNKNTFTLPSLLEGHPNIHVIHPLLLKTAKYFHD
jgi:hypothetical protein